MLHPYLLIILINDFGNTAKTKALNLISIYKLPVLIVIEDNGIAQTTL